jgi:hypothetical protein
MDHDMFSIMQGDVENVFQLSAWDCMGFYGTALKLQASNFLNATVALREKKRFDPGDDGPRSESKMRRPRYDYYIRKRERKNSSSRGLQ